MLSNNHPEPDNNGRTFDACDICTDCPYKSFLHDVTCPFMGTIYCNRFHDLGVDKCENALIKLEDQVKSLKTVLVGLLRG